MSEQSDATKPLVPSAGVGLLPHAAQFDHDAVLESMQTAMGEAFQGMIFANVPVATAAAQKADAYFLAIPPTYQPTYLKLTALRALTHIFSLTALILQQAGELAISEAYQTYEQITDYGRQGKVALDILFDAHPDAKSEPEIAQLRDAFPVLVIANEAGRLALEAQDALYRRDSDNYLAKLAEASASFRRVRNLQPSLDTIIIALKQQQIAQADRLDRQAKNYRLDFFVNPVERFIPVSDMKKILIIHGHAEARWREMRDLLVSWGLETVVLWEEVSSGQTIIDKFQRCANECCFAFALVTPDDSVEKDTESYRQARPNVIFETGWFFGRFGPSRVGIITQENTVLPSDLSGIVTFRFNKKVEEEAFRIQNSLKSLGVLGD